MLPLKLPTSTYCQPRLLFAYCHKALFNNISQIAMGSICKAIIVVVKTTKKSKV